MYDLNAVKRKIKKDGINKFIFDLSFGIFPEEVEENLINLGILSNGYPNLSFIYSLA